MSEFEEKSAARLRIEGRVQGVGFRYFVYKNARRNGLCGWVKNRKDGSVEAHFEGDRDAIHRIIELCKKGPAGSNVKDLQLNWSEPEGTWKDFDFKYS